MCSAIWLLLSLPVMASGAADATEAGGPVAEKRSCIQSVDGYSYIAEDKTIADLREAALNNAKQQALKNAQTYIRSRTEVENFILKSDEVLINSEGTVTVLEMKDNGIQDNSRYHIWIKAEVEYELGAGDSPAPAAVSQSENPAVGPLTVKVWSTKAKYRTGEKIEIYIQGNQDFYARIVDITSTGDIVQLLPNDFRTASFFRKGIRYKIPDAGDQFDLTVGPPFGDDTVIVYASDAPLGDVAMHEVGHGLRAFDGDRQNLGLVTRGIAVTARTGSTTGAGTGAAPPQIAEFYEAEYKITTMP